MSTIPAGPAGTPALAPRAAHPHPEPRSYPLMLRTWDYRWWRPVAGIGFLIGAFLLAQAILFPVLMIGVALQGGQGDFLDRVQKAGDFSSVTPASMLYLNLTLASAIPITWLVMRVCHHLRPRWLASVRPGMRWRFMLPCFGLAVIALIAQVVVGSVLPGDANDLGSHSHYSAAKILSLGLVILVSTPLQAIGEEYAFRGYLMQAFGSLTRSRVAAVVITSVLFALAHGVQNFPLFFDRLAFGLMAGYVVVRVGGLEAGIAMHILNNFVAFGFALALGNLDSTLTVSTVSWWNIPLTVVQNGLYLLLVLWLAKRMALRNRTDPPHVEPATPRLVRGSPVV
ncbi:MAG TPA: type II CAAX endopeptidase family protein [Marmoricola sp.]|nr:type II CAAX endopeptidase family protein [Marmoricola sp.]